MLQTRELDFYKEERLNFVYVKNPSKYSEKWTRYHKLKLEENSRKSTHGAHLSVLFVIPIIINTDD